MCFEVKLLLQGGVLGRGEGEQGSNDQGWFKTAEAWSHHTPLGEAYLPNPDVAVSAARHEQAQVRAEPHHLLQRVHRVEVRLHFPDGFHGYLRGLVRSVGGAYAPCLFCSVFSRLVAFPRSSPGLPLLPARGR